jgi:hypothetical protein
MQLLIYIFASSLVSWKGSTPSMRVYSNGTPAVEESFPLALGFITIVHIFRGFLTK